MDTRVTELCSDTDCALLRDSHLWRVELADSLQLFIPSGPPQQTVFALELFSDKERRQIGISIWCLSYLIPVAPFSSHRSYSPINLLHSQHHANTCFLKDPLTYAATRKRARTELEVVTLRGSAVDLDLCRSYMLFSVSHFSLLSLQGQKSHEVTCWYLLWCGEERETAHHLREQREVISGGPWPQKQQYRCMPSVLGWNLLDL